MNGRRTDDPVINLSEAIEMARAKVVNLTYVDATNVVRTCFVSRAEALAAGVPDGPRLRDEWLIEFARIDTGHITDGMFDSLTVSVDATTGEALVLESF